MARDRLWQFIDEIDPVLSARSRRASRDGGGLGLRMPSANEIPGPLIKIGAGSAAVYFSDAMPPLISTVAKWGGWISIISGSVDLLSSILGESDVFPVSENVRVSAEFISPAKGSTVPAYRRADLVILKLQGLPFIGSILYPVTFNLKNREDRSVTVSAQVLSKEFGSWIERDTKTGQSLPKKVNLGPLESKNVEVYVPVMSQFLSVSYIDVVLTVNVNGKPIQSISARVAP